MKADDLQDLADVVGDVLKAAAGCDIRFKVSVELGGDGPAPPEVVARVNEVLKDIADGLELE